ncbi:ATP-binding protein [Ruminococcus flavefaciens]|uniref:Novel STAND NTPase 3 domain-containing protein n=1 Tax=Ruminococcus flavefaciens TaxID=1265 RepID=A0A1K1MYT7_RUMFL|nr:ATP-binding protein [Ruminococcus flavefaciens]SFW28149.1 hypothetical protein SAMN02910280_1512 [Ruminococcus flavefaciens]
MSYKTDIQNAILQLEGGAFQNLCDEYLNECGYNNIVCLGSKPGTNKTTSGTPDTYCCIDKSGKYIFIEYTTKKDSIYNKVSLDIDKCLNEEYTHIEHDNIAEILYFHTTSNLTPEQDKELKERCQSKGILLRIYGIDWLANELLNNHRYLVKQHLGITIATDQILSYDDYIRNYNKAKTAAPIDTDFKFRTEEIQSIFSALDDQKAVLLCGAPGVGKTRLALECCHRYAEKNSYEVFCIRNNNLNIYDDLHLFFKTSGKYMVLIDDANELTQLETIINFFNEHDGSDFKIILTVRNYALQSVITELKPITNIKVQTVSLMKDDEIEELIKSEFSITNQFYLDRITKIAEGNARIAFWAGKIAIDTDSLEAINDVTDIYSSFYGKYLSNIKNADKKLFSAAAVAAFIGAIHLDNLNELIDVISLCNLTVEEFKEALFKLHKEEIINIYKEKAVRFADQCLSNYLLFYVFIKEKWIKLSDMIRYSFKVNKTQTITSINVITNLFINHENQDYLFSEVKELWNELSEKDPIFFWEYVKVFYRANPTEALLLVKDKIDNTPQANTAVEDLKIDDRNNSVNDDILEILGGFSNTNDLSTALDLYFLYYEKRPDLIDQFYNVGKNYYGVDKDSYKFDFYTLKLYIEQLIEKSDNWRNRYICRLFVSIAKYFLRFHFDGLETRRQYSGVWFRLELVNSKGVTEYRRMIWNNLKEMYSHGIEVEAIENILYNYGNPSSKKSKEIIENDQPYIFNLLNLFRNKESYYFCCILSHLQSIYKYSDITPSEEFIAFFHSKSFGQYKTFGKSDDDDLDYLEKYDELKRNVEEYVSSLGKEDFYHIIDFFCDSKANLNHYNINAINYAFEYILNHSDYYLDALKYYFNKQYKQSPLNPYTQVSLMFKVYSDSDIWSLLSDTPDSIRNIWQYHYFEALPERYIDSEHLQKWYEFLKDDSDKYIPSSSNRHLLFLKKYADIDNEVIIKSCNIILSKRKYSEYIVKIYIDLLLNPLPESVQETITIFYGNYDLLSELYLFNISKRSQEDYHGVLLKALYEKYPDILNLLFEKWKNDDSFLTHDDTTKLSKLFELDDYCSIFDGIIDTIIKCEKGTLFFQEDELKSLVSIGNLDEQYRDRPDKWINHFIRTYYNDEQRMRMISKAILGLDEDKRIEYITLFLSYNKDFKIFKSWQLLSYSMMWSGSEVPLIQKRIDYLNRLLPLLNGLDFLNHKKYIEDEIENKKEYMNNVEINEILRGL